MLVNQSIKNRRLSKVIHGQKEESMCACSIVPDSATLWTVICQAPLSMGFSRQEYWSGLSFPPPRDLPSSGIKPTSPVSPALQADSLPTEPWGKPQR